MGYLKKLLAIQCRLKADNLEVEIESNGRRPNDLEQIKDLGEFRFLVIRDAGHLDLEPDGDLEQPDGL